MPIVHMASSIQEASAKGSNVRMIHTPTHHTEWNGSQKVAEYEIEHLIWLYDTHQGLCISEYERNGSDDSDFYMVVWNEEEQKPQAIEFASTRGWSYPCLGSRVDATPEIRAKYEAHMKVVREQEAVAYAAAEARLPKKGRTVKVVAGRKLPKGTLGEVFWTGCNQFRTYYRNGYNRPDPFERIGIRLQDGSKVFTAGANVEVVAA